MGGEESEVLYEVSYRQGRRSLFRMGMDGSAEVGDMVVVKTGDFESIGEVSWKGGGGFLEEVEAYVGDIVRKATRADRDAWLDRRQKELDALQVFEEKIQAHGLPMKPVEVEWEPNGTRITFYFTADNRVDFRRLVRDLARTYRTRIELRQINPRQEMQRTGGCGSCGRPLCCTTFLEALQPVTTRAAQAQALSQNLAKLVGVCGQLKCCLRYELDVYREANNQTDCCRESCGADSKNGERQSSHPDSPATQPADLIEIDSAA